MLKLKDDTSIIYELIQDLNSFNYDEIIQDINEFKELVIIAMNVHNFYPAGKMYLESKNRSWPGKLTFVKNYYLNIDTKVISKNPIPDKTLLVTKLEISMDTKTAMGDIGKNLTRNIDREITDDKFESLTKNYLKKVVKTGLSKYISLKSYETSLFDVYTGKSLSCLITRDFITKDVIKSKDIGLEFNSMIIESIEDLVVSYSDRDESYRYNSYSLFTQLMALKIRYKRYNQKVESTIINNFIQSAIEYKEVFDIELDCFDVDLSKMSEANKVIRDDNSVIMYQHITGRNNSDFNDFYISKNILIDKLLLTKLISSDDFKWENYDSIYLDIDHLKDIFTYYENFEKIEYAPGLLKLLELKDSGIVKDIDELNHTNLVLKTKDNVLTYLKRAD